MEYILLVFVIGVVLFGIMKAKQEKEIFNPFLLFAVPILISCMVNLLYYNRIYDISCWTYSIYFLSTVSFVFGLVLGTRIRIGIYLGHRKEMDDYYVKLFWVFSIICAFFAVDQIVQGYNSKIFGENLIDNVRYYTSYVSESNFFAKYGIVTTDVLMVYFLYRYFIMKENCSKSKAILVVGLYVLFTATQFNRTNILYLVSVCGFYYMKKNSDKVKKQKGLLVGLCMLVAIMFVTFNYIAIRTNKYTMDFSGESWWIYYFGSQFYWFEQLCLNTSIRTYGVSSLGVVGRALYLVGIIPNEGLNAYRDLKSIYRNPVSSFASSPYIDFGLLGLIVLFFFGVLIGLIYKKHVKEGGIWTMFYSTCVYQLVIAFYAYQFGLSSQLYVFILLYIALNTRIKAYGKRGTM